MSYKLNYNSLVEVENHINKSNLKGSASKQFELGELTDKPKTPHKKKSIIPAKATRQKKILYSLNKSKVRAKIIALSNTKEGKKQLFFYTITFPASTPDKLTYQILNTSLTRLRKEDSITNYIWIAEKQKVGTIHYHILTTEFISVLRFNHIVKQAIATQIKKEKIPYDIEKIQKYSGVDIAKNRNTRRVTNFAKESKTSKLCKYVTKYVTKNDTKFETLMYHSSRSVSALFTSRTIQEQEFTDLMQYTIPNFSYFVNLPHTTIRTYIFCKEPPTEHYNELNLANQLVMEKYK